MEDELSYGVERAGPRWPGRWVTAAAVIAGLSGVLGWVSHNPQVPPPRAQLGQLASTPTPTPQVATSTTSTETPMPAAFEGPLLRDDVDTQVVLGGPRPAVVDLPSGRSTPVTGIPSAHGVDTAVRVRGATILMTAGANNGGAEEVYFLPDGATAARRLPVRGSRLVLGATPESFWLASRHETVDRPGVPIEERSRSGKLLRRAVLPRNALLVRGVVGGVLIIEVDRKEGEPVALQVWDPVRRRVVRSFGRGHPIAASADLVAWRDRTCRTASEGCIVHITDVRTGADRVVPLPRQLQVPEGEFSSDGTALVLPLRRDDESVRVVAVSVDTGAIVPIAGAASQSGGGVVGWTADGNAAVLQSYDADGVIGLAVWRRSADRLELVPGRFEQAWSVAVRPAR